MKLPDLPLFERAAARISTNSALNPLLWLCAIISAPCLLLATLSAAEMAIWLLLLGAFPVAVALIAYLYFMLRDPNRLQSEQYLLDRYRLERIGDSDVGATSPGMTIDLEPIENPDALENDRGVNRP